MLMPKKNLVAIYEHLFTEGVIVAMKDVHAPKHPGNYVNSQRAQRIWLQKEVIVQS